MRVKEKSLTIATGITMIIAIILLSTSLISERKHKEEAIHSANEYKAKYDKVSADNINLTNDYETRIETLKAKIDERNDTIDELSTMIDDLKEVNLEMSLQLDEYETIIKDYEAKATEEPVVEEVVQSTGSITVKETLQDGTMEYLGNYELTAYIWTGNPCANGNYPTEGYTVACNSLPLGTKIYIEGWGYYTVEDRGGMANNVIDIYVGTYDKAVNVGRQNANVYIVK